MKKISAWLKKFFRIGKGSSIEIIPVPGGHFRVSSLPAGTLGYKLFIDPNLGLKAYVDHGDKTVTFKI